MFSTGRRAVAGAVLAASAGSACVAQTDTPPAGIAPPACSGEIAQGGLALCRTEPGAVLEIGGEPAARADADGWATLGFAREAAASLEVTASLGDATSAPVTLAVAPRDFPASEVGGLDCDFVEPPRTPEVQAAIERAWVLKTATWRVFSDGRGARSGFSSPGDGPETSPYGSSRRKYGDGCERTSVHWGLDLRAAEGSDVRAPASGVVTLADDLYFEGGAVFLDHGHGLVSIFMHLSEIDVAPGDVVATGDRLGSAGMTGTANGPHIHWGLKWRNVFHADGTTGAFYIDPALALKMEPAEESGLLHEAPQARAHAE